jgi:hypothetical protein
MNLGKRASSNSVIKAIMSNANGIGQSKSESRSTSGLKGQNGHDISSKAHSISSVQNLRTATTQYVNFVKEEYGGRVLENINNETIKDFIDKKADEISGGSLNTYISELSKMSDNLNQLGFTETSRDEITAYRDDLKASGIDLHSEHVNRAYEAPEMIVEAMYDNSPYGLSAELQLEAGLRADDCINSDKWTLNEDNTLTIEGSKGGIDYTTTELSPDLAEKVAEAIENGYSVPYDDYRETLKVNCLEEWHGTHGLRYNFAEDRYNELIEQGLTDSEALAETSLEMGHSREEITEHYLMR